MRYEVYVSSAAFAFALAATPALGQTATEPPAPAAAVDVSAGVALTSDYRFRGISQSNRRPAVQGTVSVSHGAGPYGGVWASTISDYVAAGSDVEIDIYAGYRTTTPGGTTIDGGVTYYLYPDIPGATTNFFEPYVNVSQTFGALTAKVGTNFAWKQRALSLGGPDRGAFYLYGDLSGAAGPVTITGHVGRSFVRNFITGGNRYTDWSLTAAYTTGPATFSVGYVDTDQSLFSYPAGGGRNRNISQAGVVAAVSLAF